jgi:superfamily II DNA/RNA helicase
MMKNNAERIIKNLGLVAFNSMQIQAQEAIATNDEVVLIAPTGSGKTIGFLFPVFELLNSSDVQVQCLVLSPTRELCLQIEQVWKKMGTGYKVNACYGGHSMQVEVKDLNVPPALLIGTPGRIADHIRRETFKLDGIKILALDEFDKSLELGFQDEMDFIISSLEKVERKILLSATNLSRLPSFVKIKNPFLITYNNDGVEVENLKLHRVISEEKDKLHTLFVLLCNLNNEAALVFCNHRDACERTALYLKSKGIVATVYHGGMEQTEREKALVQFRNGSVNYLITTDLAARGLDIPEMNHVIHYQMPIHENEFTHRNGRTARMQAKGNAYLLLSKLEKQPYYIKSEIKLFTLDTNTSKPKKPIYTTISISGGRKNKITKVDILGTFIQKGNLNKEDIGLIEVKDFNSFVAIKETKVFDFLRAIKDQKIKGNKYKIVIAKSVGFNTIDGEHES